MTGSTLSAWAYASVMKRRTSTIRRESAWTGARKSTLPPLTVEEERILAIFGPEMVEGVQRGIDVCHQRTSQTPVCSPPSALDAPSGPSNAMPQDLSHTALSQPPDPTATPSSPHKTHLLLLPPPQPPHTGPWALIRPHPPSASVVPQGCGSS